MDIPLVKHWYKERCPPNQVVKVRVSYQKMLKQYVLNELHARPVRKESKRYLLKTLKTQASKFFETTELDWVEAGK